MTVLADFAMVMLTIDIMQCLARKSKLHFMTIMK